jgi:hypothetical protein
MDNYTADKLSEEATPGDKVCKNCSFWGGLSSLGMITSSRLCRNPALKSVSTACDYVLPTSDSIAVVSDDEAMLQTGPEFGCNQWTPKPQRHSSDKTTNNVVILERPRS